MNDKQLELLSGLTPEEIAEVALADERVFRTVASKDSRVQLMERLYGDEEAKAAIQVHSKRLFPKASVPEIDIPAKVRGDLKSELEELKALRTEIDTEKKSRRHEAFKAKLQEAGAEAEDLEAIETFMVENEIGPKSLTTAVEKFYETKESAEPRGVGLSAEFPADAKDEHMKALLASAPNDDLDRINEPWVLKIAGEYPALFPDLAPRRRR